MSGGHFNYAYARISDEYFPHSWDGECKDDPMEDLELSGLLWDMIALLHDLEWYKSGDTVHTDYLESVDKFKKKWLKGSSRTKRLTDIIDKKLAETRADLVRMIGG